MIPNGDDLMGNNGLIIGTYNINGIRNKTKDLESMLFYEKIDILAIQETLKQDTDWRLTIPGYYCFEINGSKEASERGLAILIKNTYSGYVIGESSPWSVFIRVSGGGLVHPIIIASIYIPHHQIQDVKDLIREQVRHITNEFPQDLIFLLGDWNMNIEELNNYLFDWVVAFQRIRNIGIQRTRRNIRGRLIDGLVCKSVMGRRIIAPGKVKIRWDMSDHYLINWKIDKQSVGPERLGPLPLEPDNNQVPNNNNNNHNENNNNIPIARRMDVKRMLGRYAEDTTERFIHANPWFPLFIHDR